MSGGSMSKLFDNKAMAAILAGIGIIIFFVTTNKTLALLLAIICDTATLRTPTKNIFSHDIKRMFYFDNPRKAH